MAKSKQKASKTPKKRSTKYSKLAAVCSKELSAKKAALVRAEKALAKAQKTHTELLSEVARLDMLDRSLKALINGTEPPQNVRYVYSYPQWVWQGYPYQGWYWNGNTWTLTLGQTTPNYTVYNTPASLQGGTFTNAVNTVQTTTAGALTTSGASNLNLCSLSADSGLVGYNSSGISLSSGTSSNGPATTSYTISTTPSSSDELTIDLSTGAQQEECKGDCEPACEKCCVKEEPAKVGVGG